MLNIFQSYHHPSSCTYQVGLVGSVVSYRKTTGNITKLITELLIVCVLLPVELEAVVLAC